MKREGDMEDVQKTIEELNIVLRDYIKPHTFPIAIKLLKKGEEIPPKHRRPTTSFGHRLALCQGFGFARKYEWPMAFQIEDMACGPALSYFGFVDIPEFEKEGGLVYPMYAKTPEGGKRSEEIIDKLPYGSFETVLVAPLSRTVFEPDVIMIYCNAAQIARLCQGALYCEGGGIETVVAGRCACTAEIITPLRKGRYNVVVPDGGERMFALTSDDEMVFSAPFSKVPDLMEGIVTTHKSGVARYPYPVSGLKMEPQFPEKYAEIVKLAAEII
jgi:uncharacterized protein (DUF169 family)